eukprot:1043149-Amphidinium_carterae.1
MNAVHGMTSSSKSFSISAKLHITVKNTTSSKPQITTASNNSCNMRMTMVKLSVALRASSPADWRRLEPQGLNSCEPQYWAATKHVGDVPLNCY